MASTWACDTAHLMSNENNDDNDNCENTVPSIVERETKWGKTIIVCITVFKILGIWVFTVKWRHLQYWSRPNIHTILVMFPICFLKLWISKEHNEKKPGEIIFADEVLIQMLTEVRQDTNDPICNRVWKWRRINKTITGHKEWGENKKEIGLAH